MVDTPKVLPRIKRLLPKQTSASESWVNTTSWAKPPSISLTAALQSNHNTSRIYTKLAQQAAKGITAYILLVQGYASKVGSAALNQRLSSNVTVYLEQNCQIPLTNILAPGAMGTSQQVDSDSTAEGQAENRRVVVKILQNKGT
jgi:outer membrane protein OmpA-like peptidoglycan-associated protein